jgi:hypothetical protein
MLVTGDSLIQCITGAVGLPARLILYTKCLEHFKKGPSRDLGFLEVSKWFTRPGH